MPVWAEANIRELQYPALAADISADVCIVGGGIAGLTTAYLLARAGKSVVVVEDGDIGSGETGRTTAHLSNALDDRYYELERLHGKPLGGSERPETFFDQIGRLRKADWEFKRRGKSGLWVSELLPHLAERADDLTVIRSMIADSDRHVGPRQAAAGDARVTRLGRLLQCDKTLREPRSEGLHGPGILSIDGRQRDAARHERARQVPHGGERHHHQRPVLAEVLRPDLDAEHRQRPRA